MNWFSVPSQSASLTAPPKEEPRKASPSGRGGSRRLTERVSPTNQNLKIKLGFVCLFQILIWTCRDRRPRRSKMQSVFCLIIIRSFLVRTRNEPKKPPMGVPLGTPSAVRIFKMRTGSKWAKPNAFAALFGRKGCRLHLVVAIWLGFRCLFVLQMVIGERFFDHKGVWTKNFCPYKNKFKLTDKLKFEGQIGI